MTSFIFTIIGISLSGVMAPMAANGGNVTLAGIGPEIRGILARTKLDQVFSIGSNEANTQ
jgi:anti-anti-sigma regulatory factor